LKKELIKLSKFLSLVLRHDPTVLGVKMDSEGWVEVNELIKKYNDYGSKYGSITKTILDEVVATNDKKRFAYSSDGLRIRASQGHSISIDLNLKPQDPPLYLYHGTASKFIDSILKNGIKSMNRQHVHLSATVETAIKVGSRHGNPRVIMVKALDMSNDGFDFFYSDNGVWLTNEVPVKYIEIDWRKNMKIRTEKVIDVSEWDNLVEKTYSRPYSFQQQDGCKERGTFYFKVPDEGEDFENDTVPEEVNHPKMGVSFKAWMERDPKKKLDTEDEWGREHGLSMWWERNFYPDIQMIANDLHAKGLIKAGKYCIDIDW